MTTEPAPLLDLPGLTQQPNPEHYAQSLGLEGTWLVTDEDRNQARAAAGAGTTIITGPLGAKFWESVSRVVRIKVEPEGYEWTARSGSLAGETRPASVATRAGSGAGPPLSSLDTTVLDSLLQSPKLLALDWEWHEDTLEAIGLAFATGEVEGFALSVSEG